MEVSVTKGQELAILETLALATALADQTSMQVAGDMLTVNAALSALEEGLQALLSADGRLPPEHDPSACEFLIRLLDLVVTLSCNVNESVGQTHRHLCWVLSHSDIVELQSAQWVELRRTGVDALERLCIVEAASKLAATALSQSGVLLRSSLKMRAVEHASWQQTHALVGRLTASHQQR
jgi:hypothetical protein